MYTLRKVSQSEVQTNYTLGEKYSCIVRPTILKRDQVKNEQHQFEFDRELKLYEAQENTDMMPNYNPDNIFGFVLSENGKTFPLYTNEYVYIMTENGATFQKLQ